MSVLWIGVDVFIRQIDAPGEAGVAVDDHNLPVIPVIHFNGKRGVKGLNTLALIPIFLSFSSYL